MRVGDVPSSLDGGHMSVNQTPARQKAKAKHLEMARARNKKFVDEVNANILCAHCGAQPIEWHNPDHVNMNRQHFRISNMVVNGRAIAAIQAEMERCTPLCRRCHMAEDGRMKQFVAAAGGRKDGPQPPKPCVACAKEAKPLRRGLCRKCSERKRRESLKVAS